MQPQGHVQVLCNMIDFNMTPQAALDSARFCVGPGHGGAEGAIELEEGIPKTTVRCSMLDPCILLC
jgi:gamma-glutamyltranspeptidase/glutathione hydrolase